MKENAKYTVPGSHGVGDLTLTVHAPKVELSDGDGNTVAIVASQLERLTSRLDDIDCFYESGEE